MNPWRDVPPGPRPQAAAPSPGWATGTFEPYAIGDPGIAASRVVPRPDPAEPWCYDTVLDGVTVESGPGRPALVLRAASVRGLSHRHAGKVRQDDYAFGVTHDGRYLVVAVADGVSSGPSSHLAAQLAVTDGIDETMRCPGFDPQDCVLWHQLLRHLAARIEEKVRWRLDPDVAASLSTRDVADEMATTVAFGVVERDCDSVRARRAHVVRLGDTSGWRLRRGGGWEPLGELKDEPGALIADSATSALPLVPDEPPVVVTVELEPGDALVLMTDGVGDPLGSGRGEVGAVLARAWSTPPTPLAFAAQVDFARKSFDDDRTVVAVWPVEG